MPEKRRPVPMRVQRDAALRQLGELMRGKGFEAHELELDHDPALALRPKNPETGEHEPHQHDSRYLVWRPKAEHAEKTNGVRLGESKNASRIEGDKQMISRAKRLSKDEEAFRARVLAKSEDRSGEGRPTRTGKPWPKRKLQSRNTLRRGMGRG